jgi:hypothetical protein
MEVRSVGILLKGERMIYGLKNGKIEMDILYIDRCRH